MNYASLLVDLPPAMRHPMQEFIHATDAVEYEALLTWHLTDDGTEYLLFYVEGNADRYRAAVDEIESIREYTITRTDGGSFYVYVCEETQDRERRWRSAFTNRNLVVVPPVEFDATARMRCTVVGASDDLTALVSDLQDEASVTVEAVGEYDRWHGAPAAKLTDRQLEAVRVAVEVGYYDVPRENGLARVAAELDCAESTASTLLRRAEGTVLSAVVTRRRG